MEPGRARRRRRTAVTKQGFEESLMRFWPLGLRAWVLAFFCVAMFSAAGQAQAPTGRLRGQIVDPTGAVIPQADITVKNASGLVVAGKSGGAGEYDFRNLPPGKYTVTV